MSGFSDVKVSDLRVLLQAQCPGLIHELVPGCRRAGNVFEAPNPLRAEKSRSSFRVWMKGAWKEYDSGEAGDILGLLAYVGGYEPKSKEGRRYAIQEAKRRLGLDTGDRHALLAARKRSAEKQVKDAEEERQALLRKTQRVLDIVQGCRTVDVMDATHWVVRYLRDRGLDPAKVQNRANPLLFHPNLRHWSGADHRGPAWVARVLNPNGATVGVHAVFLREHLGKIVQAFPKGQKSKLMLGTVLGCVVPISLGETGLSLSACAAQGLSAPVILCEGRETGEALAVSLPEARVWACLSLSNIGNAPVNHPAISAIFWARENDTKPQAVAQAEKVLEALEATGKPVVEMKSHAGSDFADLVAEGEEDNDHEH